jgi:carboxymethylenebutenolidase
LEKLSMSNETFVNAKTTYKITIYPAPPDGKKHPVILLVHGNFGLGPPYGAQIQGFARDLAGKGYVTAVPQYYEDDKPHVDDKAPHVQTLTDAIAAVVSRSGADATRLGLIGFSLGAATAMTFITSNPLGTVKVLADFFGFLTPNDTGWSFKVSSHHHLPQQERPDFRARPKFGGSRPALAQDDRTPVHSI